MQYIELALNGWPYNLEWQDDGMAENTLKH